MVRYKAVPCPFPPEGGGQQKERNQGNLRGEPRAKGHGQDLVPLPKAPGAQLQLSSSDNPPVGVTHLLSLAYCGYSGHLSLSNKEELLCL